jgi:hypothetical protein
MQSTDISFDQFSIFKEGRKDIYYACCTLATPISSQVIFKNFCVMIIIFFETLDIANSKWL